ncbi:hypothetical protein LTR36_002758 [Oleoguttula mirabilis]|uniref:Short-chain dehydrogenase n=1 Tax=Oleoguttula mirabilis TaxID=1507867 RepID=A0AAV9JKH1_9PEZI|nr:hypothetical protein LTR36_002758 [Oleoguttula mirabilis]
MSLPSFFYSQLIQKLPYPEASFSGKTVIVTGSNVGLGKEAARHIARLGASNLILAVRNIDKGNAAKEDIERSTGCSKDVIKVWLLDMADYSSVTSFAARASKELERVDVLLANAGIASFLWRTAEDNEAMITVNVVSTFLLTMLMMPKLKDTARKYNTRPVVTITSSEVHARTTLPAKSAPDGQIFQTLNDISKSDLTERYPVSKLLEVFGVRAIADRLPSSSFPVTIDTVNPGLCHSCVSPSPSPPGLHLLIICRELAREGGWAFVVMKAMLARSTEYGSRTLVHAASQGPESHGQYLSDCKIAQPSPFVTSEEGKVAQDRVWNELVKKLEAIEPGVTGNLK